MAKSTVLIIVNSDIKPKIQASLKQYIIDLEKEGYYVPEPWQVKDKSPVELRTDIRKLYDALLLSEHPLAGCVLIGDLPVPWYRDSVGNEYPLDSFYMDLHGDWGTDDKGEKIVSIPDQINPEIWIGRLTARPLTGDEVELLKNYFQKNHEYRTVQWEVEDRAMAYVDEEWIPKEDYGMGSAYKDKVTLVNGVADTNAADYRKRLAESYEFIQLAVHSELAHEPQQHHFKNNYKWEDDLFKSEELFNIKPQAVFYSLDGCKSALYTESNYIGGCYIFSPGLGLAVIGETQRGNSMEYPDKFYELFGGGLSLGESFLGWLKEGTGARAKYHKERTILGDPTLKRQSKYI